MVLKYEAARGEAMRLSGFHAGIENPNLGLKIEEIEDLSAIDGSIITVSYTHLTLPTIEP